MFQFTSVNSRHWVGICRIIAPGGLRFQKKENTIKLMNATIRYYSQEATMDEYEQKIYDKLKHHFNPIDLHVKDVSGGCGSMFAILVQSEKFKGIPMIKQHRLVNELLKDEIAQWHGLQLRTKAP
jgi:stress-induced morphogen